MQSFTGLFFNGKPFLGVLTYSDEKGAKWTEQGQFTPDETKLTGIAKTVFQDEHEGFTAIGEHKDGLLDGRAIRQYNDKDHQEQYGRYGRYENDEY